MLFRQLSVLTLFREAHVFARHAIRYIAVAVVTLIPMPARAQAAVRQGTQVPPAQTYDNRLTIRVQSMRIADSWKMFGDMPGTPTARPQSGQVLLVVTFHVADAKTGKANTDQNFENFELTDTTGTSFKSSIVATDLREMAFSVPVGTRPKTFKVGGVSFDVSRMPVAPRSP